MIHFLGPMIPEKLVTFYGTTLLGQNLALVPRLPNAICGFHLWPRSQNGGAKTTTWLSVGLRDWKHQTGHFWRFCLLHHLSTSGWPLACCTCRLFSKLFRLAARTLRDISNSFCTRTLNGDFPSERNAGGPIGYQARTRRHWFCGRPLKTLHVNGQGHQPVGPKLLHCLALKCFHVSIRANSEFRPKLPVFCPGHRNFRIFRTIPFWSHFFTHIWADFFLRLFMLRIKRTYSHAKSGTFI